MSYLKSKTHRYLRGSLIGLLTFIHFSAAPAVAQPEPFLPGSGPVPVTDPGPSDDEALPEGNDFDTELGFEDEDYDFEASPEALENETRRDAFDAALQGLLPLKPGEVRELLEHFDRTQESVELPVYPAPKPEVAVETLSMDPGTKPTTIKVAYGYVTTLNIVDSTGAPWPIGNVTWAGNFDVVEFTDDGAAHYIRITPQSEFAYGNMSISMLGLQTPIIISLETSRETVHYRFDAIVPEPGPLAKTPLIEGGVSVSAGDVEMAAVLQGVVPQSSVRLDISGADSRTSAYRYNGLTYLRTPLSLLSPGWMSSASSADGMHVYALEHAPVLLLSDRGKMVRVRLSDREDVIDE